MDKLSIIVPCYNEEESIPLFYSAVSKVLTEIPNVVPEYWFINDGSDDDSLKEIKNLSESDKNVHYVSFSRNFGKKRQFMPDCKILLEIMW